MVNQFVLFDMTIFLFRSVSKLQKAKAMYDFLDRYPRFLHTGLSYTKLYKNMDKISVFLVTLIVFSVF